MGNLRGHAGLGRIVRIAALAAACLALANCANDKLASKVDPKYGVTTSARVVEPGEPIPKGGGAYRVGKPYTVAGRTYTPEEDVNYRAEGMASWYGDDFHGRLTANGEVYDMNSISAAHPTLPIPSYVRVTNLANRRSIVVRVNDRGPYHGNRIIDLSAKTSQLLEFHGNGLARVRVEYIGRAPLKGSDDRKLIATLRQGGETAPAKSKVMVAEAKPFVPEYFDARPMTGIRSQAPAAIEAQPRKADIAPVHTPAVRSSSLEPPPAPSTPRNTAAAPKTSPVSAFAPVRYDNAAGFMSGRGLY